MTPAAERAKELKPCPFCGDAAPEFERIGSRRQSCIVKCSECGTTHESGDEDERSGTSWNRRPIEDSLRKDLAAATERADDQEAQRLKTVEWAGMLKDRADGAEKLASDRLADIHALENRLAATTERADRAEKELATSRTATGLCLKTPENGRGFGAGIGGRRRFWGNSRSRAEVVR